MTKEELVKESMQLPVDEREALVEELLFSIRKEVYAGGESTRGGGDASSKARAGRQNRIAEKLAAVHRLRGMFRSDGPPPTDEELKQDYIDYLTKKYS